MEFIEFIEFMGFIGLKTENKTSNGKSLEFVESLYTTKAKNTNDQTSRLLELRGGCTVIGILCDFAFL